MNQKIKIPYFVPGDLDGFFGLFIDNLVNLIIIATTLTGLFKMPSSLVFGRIIPGCAIAIIVGNIYYTLMARRLAKRENRFDVTTLPYGISTPIMFAYLFLVIGPVYWRTNNPFLSWKVGVSAAFIGGVIEFLGAFIGPYVRRNTPRAALLGTLAGIAITWIAMKPTVGIFEHPLIGFIPLSIILIGFIAKISLPFNLPAGFVAILLGSIVAWITGFRNYEYLVESSKNIGFYLPKLSIKDIVEGIKFISPYLMVIIPMGVYNFIETMNNCESASAAGDNYNTKEAMMVDGIGTMIGAIFGGCFPTTVYIGHPGWKRVGARMGYTFLNGVVIFILAITGFLSVAEGLIPKEVAFVILLYIALVIGAQAFQEVEKKYAPAVVFAFVPHIANFVRSQIDSVLNCAGTDAFKIGVDKLIEAGVHYKGLFLLGEGSIVTGLILGAITSFLIDRKFLKAGIYSIAGAVLTFFGFIHSGKIGVMMSIYHFAGYLLMSGIFFLLHFLKYEKTY
ncbi:MAG: regulator [Caldiserica bacterium]|nr:MAG: regulator [Caldisericota bacterium]